MLGGRHEIEQFDPVAAALTLATILDWNTERSEAQQALNEARRREPDAYCTNYAVALFNATFKEWPAAEKAARVAVAADPGRVPAYNVLAVAEVHGGELAALDATLKEAKRAVFDDRSPYFYAARALIAANVEPQRARRYLDAYISQQPEAQAPSRDDAEALRSTLASR